MSQTDVTGKTSLHSRPKGKSTVLKSSLNVGKKAIYPEMKICGSVTIFKRFLGL